MCLEHPELNVFAEPAAVVFSEYEAGKSYTKTLTIRNKSKHSHRFRICPLPAFEYPRNFTWTLSKSPVGDNGLVAPGMSLQYDVTFRPQSLVNETFLLQVFTEDGYSFKVPISAQRQSPALTLPDELHCGPCRAGFVAHKKWDFVNDGGPGKFILLSESETRDPWDIIRGMDEDVYSNSMVYKEGPFEISPAFFSVDSAEKKTLYVKYNAEEIKETTGLIKSDRRDTILIKIGCENGQILELPIVGMAQSSRLKISRAQTEDGTILQRNEILKTDKYDMVINYGNQNPHAVSTYLVAVKNLSKLKLPFRWVTYENQGEFATDVIPNQSDPDDSFQIIPSRGWLGPECETTFEINFSPETTRIYDVLAKLLLCNDTPRISASQAPMETEETALSLCCRGEGIVYDVAVSPPTINIPGVLHSTVTHMTQIRLHNHSVSKLAFEWLLEDMDEDVIDLEMSQTSGAISAGSVLLIDIKLTPKFPQKVSGRLVCSTGHGLGPQLIVPINAIVELKPGTLEFTKPMIDFGLLALGSMATAEVALVNHSTHAVAWAVQGHSRLTKDEDLDCVMTCEPSGGYLEASQSQTIKLQYTPLWYQSFRGLLNCQILGIWDKLPDMTVLHLPHCEPVSVAATRLKAEVQTPRLQCCNPVNVVSCFKDVPFIWTITLENMTMLETSYAWLECDEPDIEVVYLPKQGHIGGKEHREIRLQVTLKTVGEHKDLSFCCHVTDMVENNGLVRVKLEAYVRPVDVVVHVEGNRIKGEVNAEPQRYSTRKLAEDALTAIPHVSSGRKNLMFDFGSDCPVFGTRMRSLVVRNMTSATVPFQVLCEKFFARIEKASYSKRSFEGPDQGVEDTILKKTPRTRHGFSSKTGQSFVDNINKVREMMQEMHDILRDGRGAAFYPVPGQGTLGPWEEIKIDIMAYNNLVSAFIVRM